MRYRVWIREFVKSLPTSDFYDPPTNEWGLYLPFHHSFLDINTTSFKKDAHQLASKSSGMNKMGSELANYTVRLYWEDLPSPLLWQASQGLKLLIKSHHSREKTGKEFGVDVKSLLGWFKNLWFSLILNLCTGSPREPEFTKWREYFVTQITKLKRKCPHLHSPLPSG